MRVQGMMTKDGELWSFKYDDDNRRRGWHGQFELYPFSCRLRGGDEEMIIDERKKSGSELKEGAPWGWWGGSYNYDERTNEQKNYPPLAVS